MSEDLLHAKEKEKDNKSQSYSIYRTVTRGEPAVVVQSHGSCMIKKNGGLSNMARCTIYHEVGPNVVRAIMTGNVLHFHMKKDGRIIYVKPQVE